MPKIIKDADKKITARAVQIFLDEGFEHIDIRRIAKECKIGVGTVYNYFPNKKAIMTEVFNALWNDSFRLLDQLIENAEPNPELFLEYAEALYREMGKKNGIGKLVIWLEMSDMKHVQDLENVKLLDLAKFGNTHINQIKALIVKSFKLSEIEMSVQDLDRLAETTLLLLMTSVRKDREYAVFIQNLIAGYLK